MFRLGAQRCAGRASVVALSPVVLRSRAVLPARNLGNALAPQRSLIAKSLFHSTRPFSSEAAAPQTPAPDSDDIRRFSELERLNVNSNLIRGLTKEFGYDEMTPVQAKTIVPALNGTDIVAQARTGTGKTLAFLVPMFQRMIANDESLTSRRAVKQARSDDIRGIVLSPTRELAEQIAVEAKKLARNTGIVVQVAVGGTDKREMLRQTRKQGCHLLVATPGRLNDLLESPRFGIAAPRLAAFVLDEADRILDVGFEKQIDDILGHLPKTTETPRQTMLVSATIPENVISLARRMVRVDDFEFVQTIPENESLTHERVPQHLVPLSSWATAFPTLYTLIQKEIARAEENPAASPFKAIIYLNTTALVELAHNLHQKLSSDGRQNRIPAWSIQSKNSQSRRQYAADSFRKATSGILFSSDVTARGMDFPNVTHVIQVDVPRERESYIHRIGRTARQGKEGQGWLLLPDSSIGQAGRLLRGLPLQPNRELADIAQLSPDSSSDALPPIFSRIKDAAQQLDPEVVHSSYHALLSSGVGQKQRLANGLYEMWTGTFGMDNVPSMTSQFAAKMGLSDLEGLNIRASRDRHNNHSDDRAHRRESRSFGRGDDVFDRMRGQIRSDRPSGGARFGGGDRSRGDRGGRRPSWGSRDSQDPW